MFIIITFITNFKKAIDFSKFIWYNNICCETLAQPVEHTPFKRRVEGSNPSCLTIDKKPVLSGTL